jgi:hypothetical protein
MGLRVIDAKMNVQEYRFVKSADQGDFEGGPGSATSVEC